MMPSGQIVPKPGVRTAQTLGRRSQEERIALPERERSRIPVDRIRSRNARRRIPTGEELATGARGFSSVFLRGSASGRDTENTRHSSAGPRTNRQASRRYHPLASSFSGLSISRRSHCLEDLLALSGIQSGDRSTFMIKRNMVTRNIFGLAGLWNILHEDALTARMTPQWIAEIQARERLSQFVNPLPILSASGGTIQTVIADAAEIEMHMREFRSLMLPADFVPALGAYQGTWVWGYVVGPKAPAKPLETYIGPVIVATRGKPTQVRYVNDLGDAAHSRVLAWVHATDQTLHWANPGQSEMESCSHHVVRGQPPQGACGRNYMGSIPAVPHLHGGELPAALDGGPDAWFTSDGLLHGRGYYSKSTRDSNCAVYRYPNTVEAALLWFHDHVLGLTRLNVYAGLAGAYLLLDPRNPPPSNLPGPSEAIPLVLQDRMFDTNGQLYFPNEGVIARASVLDAGVPGRRDCGQRQSLALPGGARQEAPLPGDQRLERANLRNAARWV